MPAFHELVQKKLKQQKLSIAQGAKATGITYPAFAAVAKGESLPNARSIDRWADFLGRKVDGLAKLIAAEKEARPAKKKATKKMAAKKAPAKKKAAKKAPAKKKAAKKAPAKKKAAKKAPAKKKAAKKAPAKKKAAKKAPAKKKAAKKGRR